MIGRITSRTCMSKGATWAIAHIILERETNVIIASYGAARSRTRLVVLRVGHWVCLLTYEKKAASASGREQMPLTACVATLNGLRLEHSAKLNPDRRVSQRTAWIGSRAEFNVRWLFRRWLKSASASIPARISTIAAALWGTNNFRTSITGVIPNHSRNSCIDPLQFAGSLVSTEGSP